MYVTCRRLPLVNHCSRLPMVLTLFHIDNFRNLPSNYLDKMITNLRFVRVKPIINSQRFIQIKKADEIKIDNQIQQTIKKSLLAQQKDLRSKYKFEYDNQIPLTGWNLYSAKMLESGSFGYKPLKIIGSVWLSMSESERGVWKEKAKIENEKRSEANEPAILEAIKNKEFLALSYHEFKKYKPNQEYIYKYELSVLRLKTTKKILQMKF